MKQTVYDCKTHCILRLLINSCNLQTSLSLDIFSLLFTVMTTSSISGGISL